MLLAKAELNTFEILIPIAFIDSYMSYEKFVSVNNVPRDYNEMKEEIKNPETSVEYST